MNENNDTEQVGFFLNPETTTQRLVYRDGEMWSDIKIKNYVKRRLSHTECTNEGSCTSESNIWQKVIILNWQGQNWFSKSSNVYVCFPPTFKEIPTHILLDLHGRIKAHKLRDLTWWQILVNLITDIIKTVGLMATFMAAFGESSMWTDMTTKVDEIRETLKPYLKWVNTLIDLYKQAAKSIDDTLDIKLLEKLSRMGRVIIPEYDEFWRAQESMLSNASNKIFGNTDKLTSYVHLAELFYRIEIQNAKASNDDKRFAAAQHGADVTHKIINQLDKYEKNPLQVWSDIMEMTFGKANAYIEDKGVYSGEAFFESLAGIGEKLDTVHDRLSLFGMFAKEYENIGFDTMFSHGGKIVKDFDEFYGDTLRPAFRVVNQIVDKQQKAIAALEKKLNDDLKKRARSNIITADPDSLNPRDKIIQSNQFIKMLNNAIPGIDKNFDFNTVDIGDFPHE